MSDLQLVVFDLAGTTVRDDGQVPRAFTTALGAFGIDVTAEQLSGVRGASKRQAILHFIPDDPNHAQRADAAFTAFQQELSRLYRAEGVRPIDGAGRVFESLRARGVRVALNTGFDREITTLLLATLKWDAGVVDAVVCGDDVTEGRPAPDLIFQAMAATGTTSAGNVASVGDTVLDLTAGHNAGVRWNIGVWSGAHDRDRLAKAPHTHLIASVAELFTVWSGQV